MESFTPSIIIRPETGADRASVKAIVGEAFPDARPRRLIDRLRAGPYFRPELSCVAARGEERLGYALCFPVMVQGDGRATKAVHMSPIAVRDVPERRGVGERLVRHGLQRAHALGYEAVLLMGPVEYFSCLGLRRASELGLKAALPVADEHFLVHLMRPELVGQVQGRVLYPPGVLGA